MGTHYDNRRRATIMLRQELASKPCSVEDLTRLVMNQFGFSKKFVLDFLEAHSAAIKDVDGMFEWKA